MYVGHIQSLGWICTVGAQHVRGGQIFCAAGPRPGGALAKFSPAWGQSRARRGVVLGLKPNSSSIVACVAQIEQFIELE